MELYKHIIMKTEMMETTVTEMAEVLFVHLSQLSVVKTLHQPDSQPHEVMDTMQSEKLEMTTTLTIMMVELVKLTQGLNVTTESFHSELQYEETISRS